MKFLGTCNKPMFLEKYQSFTNEFAWWCSSKSCEIFRKRISVRENSFFKNFPLNLKTI
jgi:hypothetical protein